MESETLLMVDLTEIEEMLIHRLIHSFEINAASVKSLFPERDNHLLHGENICLVIVHADPDQTATIAKIHTVKTTLTRPVPLLLLVSEAMLPSMDKLMKAGADDYVVMPLDEESFAMRFYVLLECGQAIRRTRHDNEPEKDAWQIIMEYLQEGIRFFAPKSQLFQRGRTPISNRWLPVKKIATGGDAEIWLVQNRKTAEKAVAKIPHTPGMNINALRAAAVLKRLVYHPNIVHLIEVVKEDNRFILIQEYVKGATLSDLLATRPTARQKEALFLQLLSVVAYAHGHGIMHRDIKPDNIMVRPDGRLKLLDFGSAKKTAWEEPLTPSQGTLNFMPPEQFEGKTCLASDVWALGIILYLFTVNRLPLHQDNSIYPMDVDMEMHVVKPRDIIPEVPVQLEQVIMTCLAREPGQRYRDGSILRNDLLKKIPDFGNGNQIPEW